MKIPKSAKGQRLPNPDLQWQLTEEKSLDGRIHFKVFNRSPNSYLAFKIGTRSEHMSLFTVNPNPGLIKPSSGILIQISLAVSSQDSASLPKATAIFSIVSKQVPWESERHSIRDYRFTDQFCCQANVSEQSLKLIEKPDGFRIHSTPNKARPRPRRSLVGPPPPGNDSLCSPFNTSLSSINSYGSNSSDSTILDNVTLSEPLMPPPPTEISMAQTHRQSVFAPDETDDLSGQPSTVNTIVFGIIAALSHIFCFALYTGTSWEVTFSKK